AVHRRQSSDRRADHELHSGARWPTAVRAHGRQRQSLFRPFHPHHQEEEEKLGPAVRNAAPQAPVLGVLDFAAGPNVSAAKGAGLTKLQGGQRLPPPPSPHSPPPNPKLLAARTQTKPWRAEPPPHVESRCRSPRWRRCRHDPCAP